MQTKDMAQDKLMVIVAGGSGTRMGGQLPKQFMDLMGRPVLMHTVELMSQVPSTRIVVVLPSEHQSLWQDLCKQHSFSVPHTVVSGGATRHQSVANGLAAWDGEHLIGVHDGVRPLVSLPTLVRCYAEAEEFGSAIPVMPSIESVRVLDPNGTNHAVDRSTIMMVQTPQVFRANLIIEAFKQPESPLFTDEASVLEAAGHPIHLTQGNRENIKLTTPPDMAFAQALMEQKQPLV